MCMYIYIYLYLNLYIYTPTQIALHGAMLGRMFLKVLGECVGASKLVAALAEVPCWHDVGHARLNTSHPRALAEARQILLGERD